MSILDTSGRLLEGIRVSTGNNAFTFPPRDFISDDSLFQSLPGRAEYVIIADSLNSQSQSIEIADPNLRFLWTKNETGATRFNWDGFGRRWIPAPGASPDKIGIISNDPRLIAAVPNPTVLSAPFSFYIGTPVRLVTFNVLVVNSSSIFTDPNSLSTGTIEISKSTGEINFSTTDLNLYDKQSVFGQRQNFFDRTQNKGSLGSLPFSSSIPYFIFMNPLPGSGQSPRIRLGYGGYLLPIEVPDEASLGSPASGTFTWSLDTGRLKFADSDVDSNQESTVYYDGVTIGSFQLNRVDVGPITSAFPSASFAISDFIGSLDSQRYIVFAELVGQPRNYFSVQIINSNQNPPIDPPSSGIIYLDTITGDVFFSPDDLVQFSGWSVSHIDSVSVIEQGVSFQAFRSGVNGFGESVAPDFVIRYLVSGQIVQDGIGASPFVILPITPIVDNTLSFSVESGPGSTGTFAGELFSGIDSTKPGLGYLLDLDQHQLKFSFRKTVQLTLAKATPIIKLADAVVSPKGFEVTLDGNSIIPGIDFNFNADTGLLEFTEPIGEDDPNNILGIGGVISLPHSFISDKPVFAPEVAGKLIFIPSGDNEGIYTVSSVLSSTIIKIEEKFTSSGSVTVDLRQSQETIADRFWTEFKPGFKKFSLSQASSPSGPYTRMDESEFSVLPTVGQIALTTPAKPGQSFQASYIYLSSPDNGVTVTPVSKVEKALFKIRQETGISVVGLKNVSFNLDSNTVSLDRPIQIAINGQTQDPGSFEFISPSTIKFINPIKTGDVVIIDYWVLNAPGGNTSFNLLFTPIDLDPPSIGLGVTTAQFNGNQTNIVSSGSAFYIGEKDVVIVQDSSYNSFEDATNVVFERATPVSSDGSSLLVTGPITGSYRIAETAAVDVFPKGTNVVSIAGNRPYLSGMIITVDGDPYSVLNSRFDPVSERTKISVSTAAYRNYIIPELTHTIRPVLNPDSKFSTLKPADLEFPITLIRMGNNRAVLVKDVDFTVAEGGIITLTTPIQFGDSLHALYVARQSKPAGSQLVLNYSFAVAPNLTNGLLTQRLLASYNLYAPDTFFYRIETFSTYLPEVIDLLKQSSQSGGSSGPDISNKIGLQTKDFGNPSLFFPEQNAQNVDAVVIRLLKYYNDLVNLYEDLLANLDGRVVGGTDGRFRFDGKTNNPPRNSLQEVTNDIDDTIRLFDIFQLTGFFSFESVPVYDIMGGVNRFSRFFRTLIDSNAALNDKISFLDLGNAMGSLQLNGAPLNNILSVSGLQSTFSNGIFTSTSGGGFYLNIPINGDPNKLIPPFMVGQTLRLFGNNGAPDVLTKILDISGTGPFVLHIDNSTTLSSGSILQDITDSDLHFYSNGRDLIINSDSGQIINFSLPPPFNALQNPVAGNEIIHGQVVYTPTNVKAARIPVLDGSPLLDNFSVSQPQLKYSSESDLLFQEQLSLNNLGLATVTPNLLTLSSISFSVSVGDIIRFVTGPNAGLTRTINSVLGPTTASVSAPWNSLDVIGNDLVKVRTNGIALNDIVLNELGILNDNVVHSGALIGTILGELPTADAIIKSYGIQQISGIGNASSDTLTDFGTDFLNVGVNSNSLIYVPSGANIGVYKASSVTINSITVDTTAPFTGFPFAVSSPYVIIQKYSFVGLKGPQFLSDYFRKTKTFYDNTKSWFNNISSGGKVARGSEISARLLDVADFIKSASSVLGKGDKLYDLRYVWIDQRVNRKTGTLTKIIQTQSQRVETLQKILEDEQKLLIVQNLI